MKVELVRDATVIEPSVLLGIVPLGFWTVVGLTLASVTSFLTNGTNTDLQLIAVAGVVGLLAGVAHAAIWLGGPGRNTIVISADRLSVVRNGREVRSWPRSDILTIRVVGEYGLRNLLAPSSSVSFPRLQIFSPEQSISPPFLTWSQRGAARLESELRQLL